MQLFGFELKRKTQETPEFSQNTQKAIINDPLNDTSSGLFSGNFNGVSLDLGFLPKEDSELINKYRDMATFPECDAAISDIINEMVVMDENNDPVSLNLDKLNQPDSIKNIIQNEFSKIVSLYDFRNDGYEIAKRWYIDGRIYYQIIIDENNPQNGIVDLKYIDPRKIKKITKTQQKNDLLAISGTSKISDVFYCYTENTGQLSTTINLTYDSVINVTSGLVNKDNSCIIGYLHKAIIPLNQLRVLEDAVIIYRLARAPERRVFYLDFPENMPTTKIEQRIQEAQTRYKNKLVYDSSTGEINNKTKFMTMLDDYWFPRMGGSRGTEVQTLPSGQQLGEMGDIEYFQQKLFNSLNVPVSRLQSENGFSLGRASEITRDELKFQKFIIRLRAKFSQIFLKALEKQLILKNIITEENWHDIKNDISISFARDNYFSELKDSEILKDRLQNLSEIEPYVGKYFSENWVRKNVLHQSDIDIEKIKSEIDDDGPADQEPENDEEKDNF